MELPIQQVSFCLPKLLTKEAGRQQVVLSVLLLKDPIFHARQTMTTTAASGLTCNPNRTGLYRATEGPRHAASFPSALMLFNSDVH